MQQISSVEKSKILRQGLVTLAFWVPLGVLFLFLTNYFGWLGFLMLPGIIVSFFYISFGLFKIAVSIVPKPPQVEMRTLKNARFVIIGLIAVAVVILIIWPFFQPDDFIPPPINNPIINTNS